jgi:hypothetical protein
VALDPLQQVVREREWGHVQAPARAILHAPALGAAQQDVPGDAVEPRSGRRRAGAEATDRDQGGGEGLRCEVGGQLGLAGPPQHEAEDGRLVARVELPERLRTARGRREEVVVREPRVVHQPHTHPPREFVTDLRAGAASWA